MIRVSSTSFLFVLITTGILAAQAPRVAQVAILKATPVHEGENFGAAVALSADGTTMVTGASHDAGAVYVLTRSGAAWTQQAMLKASNAGNLDKFGESVALSADGNTLVVGAYFEDSASKGVNGDGSDNSMGQSGAAYIFGRSGGTWTQQAYLKASNTGEMEDGDTFGYAVAISGDGSIVAVSAPSEDSSASGVNGNQADNSTIGAGAVYLFGRSGNTWAQTVYLKSDSPAEFKAGDLFGYSVALNADGTVLAVGSYDEGSATGINGEFNNKMGGSGAAFVYRRSGTGAAATWARDGFLKAKEQDRNDSMGNAIAISDDGNTVAVAALDEDTLEGGVNAVKSGHSGDTDVPDDNSSGAVYVFVRAGGTWTQQASFKAAVAGKNDQFGIKLALSGDGNTMAVGATSEDSNAKGIDGNANDDSANEAGAAYTFRRTGSTWAQTAYVKASDTEEFDEFGSSVALNRNGAMLAVGAKYKDVDKLVDAGAVYLFTVR